MQKKILGILLGVLIWGQSCKQKEKGNTTDVFTKIYNTDNLITQSFTIDNSIDNLITGEVGTILRINKNIFIDENGNKIEGSVEIKLVEALKPIDMVLGNLTTTFNNKPLETGGMININATSNGKEIFIATDKSIQIKMPTNLKLTEMSVFEGVKDSTSIKWLNPKQILNIEEKSKSISFEKTTNITYSVDGFENSKAFPEIVNNEVSNIAWAGDGLKISKDSIFNFEKYVIRFYKNDKLQTWNQMYNIEKGTNSFIEDQKINYIFSIKKLGWANIDRLLNDPRTKEVDITTKIENHNEFKLVYVTLITQRMYLSGYQKKNDTYCFTHNDEEKQYLPVGEIATIIATAYKNNKPYFAIKKITIAEKETITIRLIETTTEKLKQELKDKI